MEEVIRFKVQGSWFTVETGGLFRITLNCEP
jgi:hypothetical protein